jgi:hypothetical protein
VLFRSRDWPLRRRRPRQVTAHSAASNYAALGSPWLGLAVEQIASLGVLLQDAHDELWRRQTAINEGHGIDFGALGDVHWMPRLGEDNLLMTFARNGAGELAKFYTHALAATRDLEARLVVFDTAADVFGGNENDRGQVRQFGHALWDRSPKRSMALSSSALTRAAPVCPLAKAMGDLRGGRALCDPVSTFELRRPKHPRPSIRTLVSCSVARRTMQHEATNFACDGEMD